MTKTKTEQQLANALTILFGLAVVAAVVVLVAKALLWVI